MFKNGQPVNDARTAATVAERIQSLSHERQGDRKSTWPSHDTRSGLRLRQIENESTAPTDTKLHMVFRLSRTYNRKQNPNMTPGVIGIAILWVSLVIQKVIESFSVIRVTKAPPIGCTPKKPNAHPLHPLPRPPQLGQEPHVGRLDKASHFLRARRPAPPARPGGWRCPPCQV